MNKSLIDQITWRDVRELSIAVADTIPAFPEGAPEADIFNGAIRLVRQRNAAPNPCRERFPAVARAAEKATGTRLSPGRRRPAVLVRSFIAHRLCAEGYTRSEVGRVMGMNHASILYLCRRVDGMLSLPRLYAEEVKMFEDFEGLLDLPAGSI